MKRLALLTIVLAPVAALADTPKLVKVDTEKQPLKLSAPEGWQVHTNAPRHKDLSTIAGITPDCAGGPDISITIQLDQEMKIPGQLLADQYKGMKPKKLHGWDCIVRDANTEVMCAGSLKGLAGIVGVYFATTSADAFKKFGDPGEFTSQIAASLSWKGKVADLGDWRHEATEAAKAACK
jgi:hypothetical protein